MTACVNKKHSRRVAAAVSASLVGALTLGAAPAVVMAEEAPVEQQFVTADGAFSNATATFKLVQGGVDKGNVNSVEFKRNAAVAVNAVMVTLKDGTTVNIDVTATGDNYEIAYYAADENGEPTGPEIKKDIVNVGKYVAVLTAVDGSYKGGSIKIPFEITAIDISAIAATGEVNECYTAEKKKIDFVLGGETLTEGVDYTVKWYRTGDDLAEENVAEVKDAGTYRAEVKGIGNYAGSRTLSGVVEVFKLNLGSVAVEDLVTDADSQHEPKDPEAIWIYGERYTADDPIMQEIKAELTTPTDVWDANGAYNYTVWAEDDTNPNIVNGSSKQFTAYKVGELVTFNYDGESWPQSWDVLLDTPDTKWENVKVGATDKKGNKYSPESYVVIDQNGNNVTAAWGGNVGTYTAVYRISAADMAASNYAIGGKAVTTVHIYHQAVDADAQVTAYFDADGDGTKEPVTSVSTAYDPAVNLATEINVTVSTDTRNLYPNNEYFVTFYDAEGHEVDEVTNAGTYTMKVTAPTFKLSGTTEMTVTIGKLDASNVRSATVTHKEFDNVGSGVDYLPWRENGFALSGTGTGKDPFSLNLQYKDAKGNWVALPMDVFKVTMTNSKGEEVKRLTDEGVYTLHFEARNDDAENNYVVPADLELTVIKDGTNGGDEDANHLRYADVTYADYFADPVDWIAGKEIMTGYKDGRVFGSLDSLSRGQVACVLYNMATKGDKVDESSLHYSELHGWETGFSDVDGKAYYGKAIAWAAQSGVVNGYADGTFHADQPVTRQEFACMLANYAKKYGTFEAASSDALDEMSDAASIADFAKDSVAWAVENGIIGNSGYVAAGSTIIRADAACMVYNYAK